MSSADSSSPNHNQVKLPVSGHVRDDLGGIGTRDRNKSVLYFLIFQERFSIFQNFMAKLMSRGCGCRVKDVNNSNLSLKFLSNLNCLSQSLFRMLGTINTNQYFFQAIIAMIDENILMCLNLLLWLIKYTQRFRQNLQFPISLLHA